jgi:hypothetical protein
MLDVGYYTRLEQKVAGLYQLRSQTGYSYRKEVEKLRSLEIN